MPVRFQYFSPGMKLLSLFLMMLAAIIFMSFLTGVIGWLVFGNVSFELSQLTTYPGLVKFIQTLQSLLVFVVPSALAAKLFYPDKVKGLADTKDMQLTMVLASVIIIALGQMFIGWSGYVNSKVVLPESWSAVMDWIQKTEAEAMELIAVLTRYDSAAGFFLNIVIIAFIPALGEEWFFRGHVQKYFTDWFRNAHLAIFVTAILFSAMHLQFMTFLPRFFLGLMLGYLFYVGGNLWYSVIGHFTNNLLALIAMRGKGPEELVSSMDRFKDPIIYPGVIFSAVSVIAVFFLMKGIKNIWAPSK